MGGNHSNLVPMPFGFDYMTITFRYTDRIRIYYATDQEINIIREVLQQHWRGEICVLDFRNIFIFIMAMSYDNALKANPISVLF